VFSSGDGGAAVFVFDLNAMGIEKVGLSGEDFDVIAIIEAAAHIDLLVNDRLSAAAEVTKADFEIDIQLSEDG
jgi:hypothetical protein